jgi:hypothetical protein
MKGIVAGANCNTNSNAHTKTGLCAIFEGTPLGLIFTDRDAAYSVTPETFNTEIKAAVYASGADIKKRITPLINVIVAMSVSGGDLRTSQEGFGPEKPNGLNALREDYTITEGGYCLYKQLSKLNGRTMRVFKIDQSLNAFGTATTVEGADKMRGYLVTIGVSRRLNTGEQAGAIILSLLYSANFQNEDVNANAIVLSETVEGLSGISLQKGSAAGKARVITACSGEDLTAVYGEDLETASLYEDKTGANPTSVVYSAGVLTFTPAGAYRIADAATLKAAGIEGYEGEEEYIDIA